MSARRQSALDSVPDGSLVPIEWVRSLFDESDAEDQLGDYDVPQTAKIINKAPSTIRTMISDGRLQAYRLGREWRITADAIRALRTAEARPASTSTPEESAEPVDLGRWRRRIQ